MRLRITFSKSGGLRYIGHLDLQTLWERTVRRAGLPLLYTQGFHPGPRIQLASALPLGFIGRAEIVDIWLQEPAGSGRPVSPMAEALQKASPPGLGIVSVEEVDEHSPALQTQVSSAEYEATLLEPVDEAGLSERIAALLAAASLPRERRGKQYDLRPLIEELSLITPYPVPPPSSPMGGGGGRVPRRGGWGAVRGIFMRLSARESATGRPEEVLAVLGLPPDSARVERTRLILKEGIK